MHRAVRYVSSVVLFAAVLNPGVPMP